MMKRITKSYLQEKIDFLNQVTGRPLTPWDHASNSSHPVSNVGNFHLSQAYGGYSLHEMANEEGGIYDTFRCGHVPGRELCARINSFIEGVAVGWEGVNR